MCIFSGSLFEAFISVCHIEVVVYVSYNLKDQPGFRDGYLGQRGSRKWYQDRYKWLQVNTRADRWVLSGLLKAWVYVAARLRSKGRLFKSSGPWAQKSICPPFAWVACTEIKLKIRSRFQPPINSPDLKTEKIILTLVQKVLVFAPVTENTIKNQNKLTNVSWRWPICMWHPD